MLRDERSKVARALGRRRIARAFIRGDADSPERVLVPVDAQAALAGNGRRQSLAPREQEFGQCMRGLARLAAPELAFVDDPVGRPLFGEQVACIKVERTLEPLDGPVGTTVGPAGASVCERVLELGDIPTMRRAGGRAGRPPRRE